MNKRTFSLLVLVFSMVFIACGGVKEDDPKDQGVGEPRIPDLKPDKDLAKPDQDLGKPDQDLTPPKKCGNSSIDTGEKCDRLNLGPMTCELLKFDGGTLKCKKDCSGFDTTDCFKCGDSKIDKGETCDTTNLNNKTCKDLSFDGGPLACTTKCTFDTAACHKCGDGKITSPEPCDGNLLKSKTCKDLGFPGGKLACKSDCSAFDQTQCHNCGNGKLDSGETCDGKQLSKKTCLTIGKGYTGGTLACKSDCKAYDETACVIVTCGNGKLDTNEECDTKLALGSTCVMEGFDGGALACGANCKYDKSSCFKCGDGKKNGAEQCDKTDLDKKTCQSQGFDGGSLTCTNTCKFDSTKCYKCSDGVKNGTEQCDKTDLGGKTCKTEGLFAGTLNCKVDCTFDTLKCHNCGNAKVDTGEDCDKTNLNNKTCVSRGFDKGTLKCKTDCKFDEGDCKFVLCPNGKIDAGEDCDGTNLNSKTCKGLGYDGGNLACTTNCKFDSAKCYKCGDNKKDTGEKCDGTDLDSKTCAGFSGYHSGTLKCKAKCDDFDLTACNKCGDGAVNGNEKCDGTLLNSATCKSLGFTGGTLACSTKCAYDTSKCYKCGDGKVNGSEACDGTALGAETCESLGYIGGTLGCAGDCTHDRSKCTGSLLAWYRLDDTSGLVQDSTGNARHGQISGTINRGAGAVLGKAFKFGGGYVEVKHDNALAFGTGSLTIEMWLNIQTIKQGILDKGGAGATTSKPGFNFISDGSGIDIGICGSGACLNAGVAKGMVKFGPWTHLALVIDRATKKATTYVDGVAKVTNSIASLGSLSNNAPLRIGHKITAPSAYKGSMDELKFYNYARSAAQIAASMGCPSGMVSADNPNRFCIDKTYKMASKSEGIADCATRGPNGRVCSAAEFAAASADGVSFTEHSLATTAGTGCCCPCGGGGGSAQTFWYPKTKTTYCECWRSSGTNDRNYRCCADPAYVPETNSYGTWSTIPAGAFKMGSPSSEKCRATNETQHQVTLTRSFEISTTEVTQAQFKAIMGYNPSSFSTCGTTCPVEKVSWHEAVAYANALSKKAGMTACYDCTGSGTSVICKEAAAYTGSNIYGCPGYRLPTEAEFEYSYRAGSTLAYYNGANDSAKCTTCSSSSKDANLDKIAWYCSNSATKTHPVGQKMPNTWGLYDMAGNVYEWCSDWQMSFGTTAVTDPVGTGTTDRVLRGGAWKYNADDARAAYRGADKPAYQYSTNGFRVVRTLPLSQKWVTIKAGTFNMGSPSSESCRDSDETQHKVTLTRDFVMASTETTQAQFNALMGYNPSKYASCGPSCPVDQGSWHEVVAYCNALSKKAGIAACYSCTGSGKSTSCVDAPAYAGGKIYSCPGYRLPTEAEWEYAYRAGTTTAFYNGGISSCQSADSNADKISWYKSNASSAPHIVGLKNPNQWGLFDMAGNVSEWCHDYYTKSLSTKAVSDPIGASTGTGRVCRGGSWVDFAQRVRAAYRLTNLGHPPTLRDDRTGVRCVRTLKP